MLFCVIKNFVTVQPLTLNQVKELTPNPSLEGNRTIPLQGRGKFLKDAVIFVEYRVMLLYMTFFYAGKKNVWFLKKILITQR